ncbi:MAG: ABC transporter ATP-binding protein [Xanthomonadales bacterium]|nr:ABC transporter ATP-binding protein [Xanthomonadales bacterium]
MSNTTTPINEIQPGQTTPAVNGSNSETLFSLENLCKVFRSDNVETTALNNINIEVKHGEFVAVMGPSGCGKSTLLNIVGMLDNPTSGAFWFNGEEVAGYGENKLSEIRKQNIGFIFQSFNLIDELTVRENIELALLYHKVSAAERKERAYNVMERMEIAHRANHMPSQLSGGQQQRVAVARAVVARLHLILADEPTGNLDSQNGQEVMEMLTQLNKQGTTILMVTHSPAHAEYARRDISLFDGEVLTENLKKF